jgi:hypothetical protein
VSTCVRRRCLVPLFRYWRETAAELVAWYCLVSSVRPSPSAQISCPHRINRTGPNQHWPTVLTCTPRPDAMVSMRRCSLSASSLFVAAACVRMGGFADDVERMDRCGAHSMKTPDVVQEELSLGSAPSLSTSTPVQASSCAARAPRRGRL